jgi:hypothetical protein
MLAILGNRGRGGERCFARELGMKTNVFPRQCHDPSRQRVFGCDVIWEF